MTLHHPTHQTGTLHQQYLSCYWPDFDQTLKVGFLDQQQQQQHNNNNNDKFSSNFDQTLKVVFWDQQQQQHNSNNKNNNNNNNNNKISLINATILTKL